MLEVVVTAGSISGIISLIGLLYIIFTKLGRMEVKICTLWKVYGEDVLERAVREGLGKRESPVRITEKGEQLIGDDIKQKIEAIVGRRKVKDADFIYFVLNETIEDLKQRASEMDVDMNSVVAAAMLYTEKVLGNHR